MRLRDQHSGDPAKRIWRRRLMWFTGACVGIAGTIWAVFFSPLFAIRDVAITGASETATAQVRAIINDWRARLSFYIPTFNNIITLRTGQLRGVIMEQMPILQSASIGRSSLHGLEVVLSERQPYGIWCRGDSCQYWDRTGARWGSAAPSVGPLLLLVQDERDANDLDSRLLLGIGSIVENLPQTGIHVRSILLPKSDPSTIRVITDKGYDVLCDASGDVADQIDTLAVFLADRSSPPIGGSLFKPQYLDLRTPGRVYYR